MIDYPLYIYLPSYQKVELNKKNENEDTETKVKNQIFIWNKKEKNINKYYLLDIITNNDFNLLNGLSLNDKFLSKEEYFYFI